MRGGERGVQEFPRAEQVGGVDGDQPEVLQRVRRTGRVARRTADRDRLLARRDGALQVVLDRREGTDADQHSAPVRGRHPCTGAPGELKTAQALGVVAVQVPELVERSGHRGIRELVTGGDGSRARS